MQRLKQILVILFILFIPIACVPFSCVTPGRAAEHPPLTERIEANENLLEANSELLMGIANGVIQLHKDFQSHVENHNGI